MDKDSVISMKRDLATILILVLAVFPWIAVTVSMFFVPDQIPAHAGFDGVVNRWGSKYELFLWPIASLITWIPLLLLRRVMPDTEEGRRDTKTLDVTNILCLLLFNALAIYFIYAAYTGATSFF